MKPMHILGIDPGQTGALAVLNSMGQCEVIYPFDLIENGFNAHGFDELLWSVRGSFDAPLLACIEHVHAFPGQGVTSMFNFGKTAGIIEGVLTAHKIPFEKVLPKVWTKSFNMDSELSSPKQRAYQKACELFPTTSFLKGPRSKVPHTGMVDAVLIAEYARRHFYPRFKRVEQETSLN